METSPFNDDVGLLGGDAQKRYKVHYPEESDTQAVIQDIKSWFSHSKDSCAPGLACAPCLQHLW